MARRIFTIGDGVPDFHCDSTSNPRYHFDTVAGRYVVLNFFGSADPAHHGSTIKRITRELRRLFDDDKIAFFGISTDPEDKTLARVAQSMPGIRFFWDFDRAVSTAYGALDAEDASAPYQPFTLVLDPFLRVIAGIALNDADRHLQTLRQFLTQLPPIDQHAGTVLTAPALLVPRVFEPAFCRELMVLYETNGGQESGFMREKDGITFGVRDHSVKRRKDFNFEVAEEYEPLRQAIRARLIRRLLPVIKKAFQFEVTRIERFNVACYEGEVGGFFRAHRDNTTKATLHRKFACTINLNAEEYVGGDLRFPEFGTRTYRAPTGGAVVFSCSLLHEATPVTQGVRYAFLPFFYDDAGAKLRAESQQFLDESVTDKNAPDATA